MQKATKATTYYDNKYFKWQKEYGEFGGVVNQIKFKEFINKSDNVIDFGCGGGYLLKNLNCKGKIGIEVNPVARKLCTQNGIKVFSNSSKIVNAWADVIISNHALEHVDDPLQELINLKIKLRKKGKIIFIVPCERYTNKYTENNVSQHLFTWSPQNIGNLFVKAGYTVSEANEFPHLWPPFFKSLYVIFGESIFHTICYIYSYFSKNVTQVRIIARK